MAVTFTQAIGNYQLLSNAADTGAAVAVPRGEYHFCVPDGTFGGATLTLQWRPDSDRTFVAVDALTTLTAAGGAIVRLGDGEVRVLVAGGPPSGVYAYLLSA